MKNRIAYYETRRGGRADFALLPLFWQRRFGLEEIMDTKIEFLYLNEEDMLKAGVLDAGKCVDTMGEVVSLLSEGDWAAATVIIMESSLCFLKNHRLKDSL